MNETINKFNFSMRHFLLFISCLLLFSCSKLDPQFSNVSDIDGNEYLTVILGDQEWMAENLKVQRYNNGDSIIVFSAGDWSTATEGGWCGPSVLSEERGGFYNFYAVIDSRGICPSGWRLPTDDDWKQLERYVGMDESEINQLGYIPFRGASDEIGAKLKLNSPFWLDPDYMQTNESGFGVIPTGHFDSTGLFGNVNHEAFFWTSSQLNNMVIIRRLSDGKNAVDRVTKSKSVGISCRCIKN